MNNPSDQWEERECNKRLVAEVAEELGINMATVEGVLQHYASFIASTIRSGSLEGVFVPYLGKFQVKLKNQQYRAYLHSLPPMFKQVFTKQPFAVTEEVLKVHDHEAVHD